MMRGYPPSGVETRGASQRIREDGVFPRSNQPAESDDQGHEQLQTQAKPNSCFRAVAGCLGD